MVLSVWHLSRKKKGLHILQYNFIYPKGQSEIVLVLAITNHKLSKEKESLTLPDLPIQQAEGMTLYLVSGFERR